MLNTIGYEGANLINFVETLKIAGIDLLIDVRDRAQSRKRGFSKTALSEALEEAGIGYLHLRELGDPKEGRDAARAGDIKKFEKIYLNVMNSSTAQEAIKIIESKMVQSNVCLLCYERDYRACHRNYISSEIEERHGTKTRHLGVRIIERAA